MPAQTDVSGDLVIEAIPDLTRSGALVGGDVVFKTNTVERARIKSDGTGTGWGNVLGGSLSAIGGAVASHAITDADFTTPADGDLGVNTSVNELVYRSSGSWYKARGSGDYFVCSSTAPSFLKASAEKVCDGVADDVEINAAVTATAAGSVVKLSGGTFQLALRIGLKDGVSIKGTGQGVTTVQAAAGVSAGVLLGATADTVSDVTISDLTIDGDFSSSALSLYGIQVTTGARVKALRVTFKNLGNGAVLFQTSTVDSSVSQCRLEDVGMKSTQDATSFAGVTFTGSASRNKVEGGWFLGCRGFGVSIASTSTDCSVVGTYFDQTNSLGYECVGVAAGCDRANVANNTCFNSKDNGISLSASKSSVTGNVIDTTVNNGIFVGGAHNTITGNTIRNVGSDHTPNPGSTYGGVNVSGTDNTIVGNTIYDDQGGSATMSYAIKESGAADRNTIGANNASGWITSRALIVGASTTLDVSGGVVALTDGATVSLEASAGDSYTLSAAGSRTIAAPTNLTLGRRIWVEVFNNTAGAITTTWNAAYSFVGVGGWTDPATTKRRFVLFEVRAAGTLIAIAKASADY